MGQRQQLNELLLIITPNVYYQPPPNVTMKYPCIVYELDRIDSTFASNRPYYQKRRYQATVIDVDPDSEIPDKVSLLPMCSMQRHFVVGNLNHDVFQLFF